MDKIKVIFLDVDGVLNNSKTERRTNGGYTFVSSRLVKNLKHIIDETNAKVVLSSDWRYDRDNPALNGDFIELKKELLRYGIKLYGYTPELRSAHRGAEIEQWLADRKTEGRVEVTDFVILDDRSDIEPNKSHWVRTVMSRGLGEQETNEAIKILVGQRAMTYNYEQCRDFVERKLRVNLFPYQWEILKAFCEGKEVRTARCIGRSYVADLFGKYVASLYDKNNLDKKPDVVFTYEDAVKHHLMSQSFIEKERMMLPLEKFDVEYLRKSIAPEGGDDYLQGEN